ncbi:hypothetical protein E2C01_055230 [Portunus trituberculatus]|uniref:Uncharacterized protein n=1 Tax=Portunus trituberculatus TaxID=210409 RepID=A0A5B7GU95_PORTR|nr:hypothetical protein [Portunus trituberculatus]
MCLLGTQRIASQYTKCFKHSRPVSWLTDNRYHEHQGGGGVVDKVVSVGSGRRPRVGIAPLNLAGNLSPNFSRLPEPFMPTTVLQCKLFRSE